MDTEGERAFAKRITTSGVRLLRREALGLLRKGLGFSAGAALGFIVGIAWRMKPDWNPGQWGLFSITVLFTLGSAYFLGAYLKGRIWIDGMTALLETEERAVVPYLDGVACEITRLKAVGRPLQVHRLLCRRLNDRHEECRAALTPGVAGTPSRWTCTQGHRMEGMPHTASDLQCVALELDDRWHRHREIAH